MPFKLTKTHYIFAAVFAALVVISSTFGINDNGYRTVVQWPNGKTFVKMEPGMYIAMFGKTTQYADVITHELAGDYSVTVRYQDGGMGHVTGVVRVALPTDELGMLTLHRAVRESEGLRNKLIYPEVKQALNLTAGLMTSEEAYAVKRNDYANWATDQIQNGRYQTILQKKTVTMQDGTKQTKEVPIILLKDGIPQHQASPIKQYGLNIVGFQLTDWDFEAATLAQIKEKRGAEMAIITARANADKAVWEQKEIAANGEKEVERVRYEQLRLKEQATIEAERKKEVAVIDAERIKEVNSEQLLAAKIDVQTAKEQATAVKTRAEAEAYQKQVVLEADGALKQKLDAYISVQRVWADAYSKRKVPQMVMGGSGTTGGNSDTTQFQTMLNALIAKDLVIDPKVTK